jgi:hypothetical protein
MSTSDGQPALLRTLEGHRNVVRCLCVTDLLGGERLISGSVAVKL